MKSSALLLGLVFALTAHAQVFRRSADLCTRNFAAMTTDGRMEIDIFLGYYDNSPEDYVVNFRQMYEIYQELTKPCAQDTVCGFVMDPSNRAKFTKTVQQNGKSVSIQLTIHNPAIHQFNSYNHTQVQRDQSHRTEQEFKERLGHGEAVFYLGHSRYGGGPDFRVPVLTGAWEVDADYYRRETPGVKLLEEGLRGGGAKLYAALSCDSIAYFARQVRRSSPRTLFIGTTLTPSYEENMALFFSTLGTTITGDCGFNREFTRAGHPARLVR
jgi:hypothetical protein